jgi:transposase
MVEQQKIRESYYLEKKSMREIAREQGHSRNTVKKAVETHKPFEYKRKKPAPAPVLGPYKEQLEQLEEENKRLPRKQRYTTHKMYEIIREAGYTGAESTVRYYVGQLRKQKKKRRVYLPLDMPMDWGEALVEMAGQELKVHLFILRWCYSRKLFVAAYPAEKQESFLDGHVRAFHYFGGLPQCIIYDNLKLAVKQILKGRNRKEQAVFLAFRNHYVIESRYCNRASGHEKGGVENDVGYVRRNFLAGVPSFDNFEELNQYLKTQCDQANQRQIFGQSCTVEEAWEEEKQHLRPCPDYDFACCNVREARLNGYSQITFQTNRYSVPTDQAYPWVTVRAYPFQVEVLYQDQILATHQRSYERNQDIIDPLHYLPLLEQRPGAFDHAQPIRQWREEWDPVYEKLLKHLKKRLPTNRAIKEFVKILRLHHDHDTNDIVQAINQALACGCAHLDSVLLCLHQKQETEPAIPHLDLSHRPQLASIGQQPLDFSAYDHLLQGDTHVH